MPDVVAWLDTELKKSTNGSSRPSRTGKTYTKFTAEQTETIRTLIRRRLMTDRRAKGGEVRRELARVYRIDVSESHWYRKFWNPIREDLGIAAPTAPGESNNGYVPTEAERSRLRSFVRDLLLEDPTLSSAASHRRAVDELDAKVSRSAWYAYYWKPARETLGIPPQKGGFGRNRPWLSEEDQYALRDFAHRRIAEQPNSSGNAAWREARRELNVDIPESTFRRRFWKPVKEGQPVKIILPGQAAPARNNGKRKRPAAVASTNRQHTETPPTPTPARAPATANIAENKAAFRKWLEYHGEGGEALAFQRRGERRWRVELSTWIADEAGVHALLEMAEPFIDGEEPSP